MINCWASSDSGSRMATRTPAIGENRVRISNLLCLCLSFFCGAFHFLPALVRLEPADLLRRGGRFRAEILFVHAALVVDEEGHHAGVAVGRRPCDETETSDHSLLHQVVVGATWGARPLPFEDAVAVTVVCGLATFGRRIAPGPGALEQRAQRTRLLARLGGVVKSIALARGADELLRILQQPAFLR